MTVQRSEELAKKEAALEGAMKLVAARARKKGSLKVKEKKA